LAHIRKPCNTDRRSVERWRRARTPALGTWAGACAWPHQVAATLLASSRPTDCGQVRTGL